MQMVIDIRKDHLSRWAAIKAVSTHVGCAPKTLFEWIKDSGQEENIDAALQAAPESGAVIGKAELELENHRLRAENAVLRQACLIFARDQDKEKI